jgi:hypothetical protein
MTEEPLPPERRLDQAVQLHQAGDLSKAEDIYRDVLEADPGNSAALHMLGVIAFQSGYNDKALGLIARALRVAPNFPEALNNMGNVFSKMGGLEDALLFFQEAVAQKPDYALAYNHLGSALLGLGRLDEAAACHEEAIALNPEFANSHFNLGRLYLLMGRLEEGWKEYGWRRQVAEFNYAHRPYAQPVWDGGNPDGKNLLLYPEQGLGDFLQFVRYIPLVAAEGGQIILETPTPMTRLLQGFDGAHTLVQFGAPLAEFDCHASLLDLPGILGTTLETIPAPANYITSSPELTDAWAERLGPREDFRIGLVWAGNPEHTNDANRSIDPGLLKPLIQIPGISIYNLQVERDGEAKAVFGDAITDLAPELKDFSETAAAIRNLDLVVSVDTSVAHLAGALGHRVWTLLPFVPDWRWLIDRDDSPWYPSMRLFRQKTAGDWPGVIKRLAAAIVKQATSKYAPRA